MQKRIQTFCFQMDIILMRFQCYLYSKDIIEYEKYANNYDYNKGCFLSGLYKLLDNGF